MKAANILKQAFDQYYPAPVEAWEEFASHCEKVQYKKGHVLKPANTRERYKHFIIKGSVGLFLWKENNFVCLDFGFENHFISDYMSLLSGEPTVLEMVVMEDSEMLKMKREDYLKLGNTEMGLILMKVAAEASYFHKQKQQIDLLTKTAEQRYLELLQVYPDIVLRIPQKHLASYLGITPQSFSRIRKNIR